MARERLRDFLPDTLSCLLTFDKATDLWLGTCLNLGLTTSGKTDKLAWENLGKVVRRHVEVCWRRDREALNRHRAPQSEWDLFDFLKKKAQERNEPFRSEKITFDLVEPENELGPLWINGLELLPEAVSHAKKGASVSAVH